MEYTENSETKNKNNAKNPAVGKHEKTQEKSKIENQKQSMYMDKTFKRLHLYQF